ncbi:hypothetical protein OCH239_03180 [Roseivivax halodurans JCM 10272]|uniref:FAS1 domain-containing protein n=1 Tax=Roseivivax halodurans JCM 10272 TaxID=1449350 RepID=X7E224_9RHOB|nr:fasciclin domain-containing protein [Roseivivax halodurans]ETX10129.1 hypothetical protein OCH239_03180 [Roseivivax halodurans JCM 10272]
MDRRTLLSSALAAGILALVLPVRAFAQTGTAPTETVAGIISSDRDLDTLASLLMAADLLDGLREAGPFTVFAPVNDAFEAMGEATLSDLTAEENADRLRRLLLHHVVPNVLMPGALRGGRSVETLAGTQIEITDEETLLIGGAELLTPGTEIPNGVVHKIGSVLEAPEQA